MIDIHSKAITTTFASFLTSVFFSTNIFAADISVVFCESNIGPDFVDLHTITNQMHHVELDGYGSEHFKSAFSNLRNYIRTEGGGRQKWQQKYTGEFKQINFTTYGPVVADGSEQGKVKLYFDLAFGQVVYESGDETYYLEIPFHYLKKKKDLNKRKDDSTWYLVLHPGLIEGSKEQTYENFFALANHRRDSGYDDAYVIRGQKVKTSPKRRRWRGGCD